LRTHVDQRLRVPRQRRDVGKVREWPLGRRLSEVAREGEARPLARELGLQRAVPELEDRGPRGQDLAGTAAAAAIAGLGHRELQFGLGDLRGDGALDPARVVAREPGDRSLPRHRERRGLAATSPRQRRAVPVRRGARVSPRAGTPA